MSDGLGLVDFAFGLVNFFLTLPDQQVKFFDGFQSKEELSYQSCSSKGNWGQMK